MSIFAFGKKCFTFLHRKFWTLVSVVLIAAAIYFMAKNMRHVEMIIRQSGLFAPFVTILLYAVLAPSPISVDPITAVLGILFGPFWGVVIGWMGNNVGAFVEYFVGKKIGKTKKIISIRKKLPYGLNKLPMSNPYVLTFGRAVPGYGGKVINLMAGIYNVKFKTFLWTTLLINLAGAILLALGGLGVEHFAQMLRF